MSDIAIFSSTTPLLVAQYTMNTLHHTTNRGIPESQLHGLSMDLAVTHTPASLLEQNTIKDRQTLKNTMTGHK